MPRSTFTYHAFLRVLERLHLSHEQVAAILDSDRAVLIAGGTGNRVYKVFYSDVDDCCFLAVQNDLTGRVVTILPIDNHGRLAIPSSAEEQARFLASSDSETHPALRDERRNIPGNTTSSFKIFGYFRTSSDEVRVVTLGSLSREKYGDDLAAILQRPDVHSIIRNWISEKRRPGEFEEELFIRSGENGEPIRFDLPPPLGESDG